MAGTGGAAGLRLTALDRVVSWLAPRAGLRRLQARAALGLATRAYEAASPRDPWKPRRAGASADADHMADAARLRAKARFLVQNVPYCSAALDAKVADVIGTGIVPRFLGPNEKRLNEMFEAWAKVCDADGRVDFYGLQVAAYRAMEQDGEVLVRLRPRRLSDRLPVPLQLQLLEIDYLDSSKNTLTSGAGGTAGVPAGNVVIEGIEYDQLGRRAAYWLWDAHPGDTMIRRQWRTDSRRVPADLVIHLFDPRRPGQSRGITRFAPVITRARDTQLLEDAELARKNLEARLSVIATGDASLYSNPMQLGGSTDAANPDLAKRTGDLGQLASGGITQLPPGQQLTVVEPTAAPGHVDNIKWHVHLVTAALGVTYESATGDMREVNYSSARVRRLDVRRLAEQQQWMVVMPRLIDPVCAALVRQADIAGLVPSAEYRLDASTPKWEQVDPGKETASENESIAGGLTSFSEVIRRRGYKPEAVFAELKRDIDTLRGDGTLEVLLSLLGKKAVDSGAEQQAAQNTGRALEAMAGVLASMNGRLAAVEARSTEVHNHVAPAQVRNELTVQPAKAEVHNHVAPAEARVEVTVQPAKAEVHNHVAPAEARVEVAVQPAEVQLRMPPRVTETRIVETDDKGRAVRSLSTERDAG
jgi:lambda family phage portal protein